MIACIIVKSNNLCDLYIQENIKNNFSQKTTTNAIARMSRINRNIIDNLESNCYYCTRMFVLNKNLCNTKSIA